jgi:hypothetical protein
MTNLNPQAKQMADESMVRNLDADQEHSRSEWIGGVDGARGERTREVEARMPERNEWKN